MKKAGVYFIKNTMAVAGGFFLRRKEKGNNCLRRLKLHTFGVYTSPLGKKFFNEALEVRI